MTTRLHRILIGLISLILVIVLFGAVFGFYFRAVFGKLAAIDAYDR
jgi:hypothetical protein